MKLTIEAAKLERIIAEAIGLAAWSAKLKPPSMIWAGRPPALAGLERAMKRVHEEAEEPCQQRRQPKPKP